MGKLYAWRVTAPHFCAGFITEAGFVVEAAPILGYMKGRRLLDMENYIQLKGWKLEEIEYRAGATPK